MEASIIVGCNTVYHHGNAFRLRVAVVWKIFSSSHLQLDACMPDDLLYSTWTSVVYRDVRRDLHLRENMVRGDG
jgi:hypothetical protein